MHKKSIDKNIRKIQNSKGSYYVTLPKEIVRALHWKERQKVVFKKKGNSIIISDWEK